MRGMMEPLPEPKPETIPDTTGAERYWSPQDEEMLRA